MSLALAGTGIVVVLGSLSLLASLVLLLARWAVPEESAVASSTRKGASETLSVQRLDADGFESALSPELVAVLTAAAFASLGKPVRVRKVSVLGYARQAWASGGRATIMASHHLPREERRLPRKQ